MTTSESDWAIGDGSEFWRMRAVRSQWGNQPFWGSRFVCPKVLKPYIGVPSFAFVESWAPCKRQLVLVEDVLNYSR